MDVMDTIVTDPFFEKVPAFFGMTLKELFQVKNGQAWIDFEKGKISENKLLDNYFHDEREFDQEVLYPIMAAVLPDTLPARLFHALHL